MALATPISGVFLGWLGEQTNGLNRPKNEGETPKAFGIKAALGRSFTQLKLGLDERGQSGKARLTHSFGNPLLLPRASLRCRMRHLAFLLTLTIPFSICTNLFAQKSQNSTNSSVEANFAGSAQKTFLDAQT